MRTRMHASPKIGGLTAGLILPRHLFSLLCGRRVVGQSVGFSLWPLWIWNNADITRRVLSSCWQFASLISWAISIAIFECSYSTSNIFKMYRDVYSLLCYGRPMEKGRPLYFCRVISIFLLSIYFFRLISGAGDWMSTILPHMVWP